MSVNAILVSSPIQKISTCALILTNVQNIHGHVPRYVVILSARTAALAVMDIFPFIMAIAAKQIQVSHILV